MNDPNGLRFVDGALHVTYQHNPDEPRWGRMHWGHAVTTDLVGWTHLPVAISPEPGIDEFGCWSGNVVAEGGVATMLYTGVRLDGELRRQSICRAVSRADEPLTWRKDPSNPVIAAPPPGIAPDLFRDPFVWRDGDRWGMLVGAGTEAGHGVVLLYRSRDLRAWEYVGPILSSEDLDPALGTDAPIWECPQLVQLDGSDVLIVSVVDRAPGIRPSHVAGIAGRLVDERFEVHAVHQLGMGPDFYAPAATKMPDGRRLLFGWIPEDPPAEGSTRTWAGSLTLPRIVSIDGQGRLALALADEVLACRKEHTAHAPAELVDGQPWRLPLLDGPLEIELSMESLDGTEVVLELRDGAPGDPIVRIDYRPDDRVLTLARAGIVGVAGRSSMTSTTLPEADGQTVRLRLLLDGSILELETNGHVMATARLQDRPGLAPVSLVITSIGGGTRLGPVDLWRLGLPTPGNAGPGATSTARTADRGSGPARR